MYSASDYRSMARRALKNYWWLAVGVTLLAILNSMRALKSGK